MKRKHPLTLCLCGTPIDPRRVSLGYTLCLSCGETHSKAVRHTVAPMNKSNYIYIHDPALLAQLNPKRTY